jgi:signal transduction histidine kinase
MDPRTLQLEMSRRAVAGGGFNIVGILFFYYATPFPAGRPFGLGVATLLMGLNSALRVGLYLFERKALAHDDRWLSRCTFLFRAVMFTSALNWGYLAVPTLLQYGMSTQSFIVLSIEPGVALLGTQNLALDLSLLRAFVLGTMGPAFVTLLIRRSAPGALMMAAAYFIYTSYLLFLAKRNHELQWEALRGRATIQRQRDQLTAVLDACPGFVVWLDQALTILGLNERLSRTYAARASDFLGTNIETATQDDALCAALRSFRDGDRGEALEELQLGTATGRRWTLLALKKYGAPQHLLAIGLDVEEHKRAELERDEARAGAFEQSQLAELGMMAAGIAHEINNPLQAITYSLGLLRHRLSTPSVSREELSTDGLRLLARATTMVQRVASIIQTLRSFVQKETASELEVVRLRDVLGELRELATVLVPRDVALSFELPPPDVTLLARPGQIGQVLLNLLHNARDAVATATEKWVHVAARDVGESVEIVIEDSGPGIPAAVRDRIMLPFFTTKGPGRGTGLGLSISKAIVDRHGGRLYLDPSAPFTRFVMVLPKNRSPMSSPFPPVRLRGERSKNEGHPAYGHVRSGSEPGVRGADGLEEARRLHR